MVFHYIMSMRNPVIYEHLIMVSPAERSFAYLFWKYPSVVAYQFTGSLLSSKVLSSRYGVLYFLRKLVNRHDITRSYLENSLFKPVILSIKRNINSFCKKTAFQLLLGVLLGSQTAKVEEERQDALEVEKEENPAPEEKAEEESRRAVRLK